MDFKGHKQSHKSLSFNETDLQKIKNFTLVLQNVLSASFRSYIDVKNRTDMLDYIERNL